MSVATTRHTYNHGTFRASGLEMEVHECGVCGVMFAFAVGFSKTRRADHQAWYCPNGHSWSFSGESDEERLKRELKAERDRSGRLTANLDQTTASLRATKGVVTKMKRRVAKGVCPCCNRTFKDLARHMESQHPSFVESSKP